VGGELAATLIGLSGLLTDHRPLQDTLTEIAARSERSRARRAPA
jgi:hypothetical protein